MSCDGIGGTLLTIGLGLLTLFLALGVLPPLIVKMVRKFDPLP